MPLTDDQLAVLRWILELEKNYPGELEFVLLQKGEDKQVNRDIRSILRRGGRSPWATSTRGPTFDDRRKFIDNLDAHAKEICRKANGKFSPRYGIVHDRLERARTLLEDLEGSASSGRGFGRARAGTSSAREETPRTVSSHSAYTTHISHRSSQGPGKARSRRRACEASRRSALQAGQVCRRA